MFYGFAPIIGSLLILNLECENYIYNIEAKHLKKTDQNTTFMWHCRHGHIGKKRMQRLHKDRVLLSFDFESFDTYEASLMGEITKTPFMAHPERVSDLLEIIHSDVCESISTQACGGYFYFITFTDDLSRYGYIYLMKYKSETFENFKKYQNKVKNHHDRKIKFL
jgi:hypothetical protein